MSFASDMLDELVRPRSGRREAQVERILDAARSCFLASGFHGASMQDICVAAGMSPGALYRYFPSKESLIEAISAIHREEDARILMTMAEGPSVAEGIVRAVVAHVRHTHETGFARLMAEIFVEGQRNPQLSETCNRSMSQARGMMRTALALAVEAGEVKPLVPLDQLVDMMMAMGHGLLTHDLPRQGVSLENIETVVRAMVVSVLVPKTPLSPVCSGTTQEARMAR